MMIQKKNLKNVLFLDIETAAEYPDYHHLPDQVKPFWDKKAKQLMKWDSPLENRSEYEDLYRLKAGIYAEFARVIVVSVGFLTTDQKGELTLRVHSYSDENEKFLLSHFSKLLKEHYFDEDQHFLCGHNIKEFDVPFLCRRMMIHNIDLPHLLNIGGKKPWQVEYLLDTMEMWKFGDYKNYTSLSHLAYLLNIPTPKDDMDGSQVHTIYWDSKQLDRIKTYCEKDVVTTAKLAMRFAGVENISNLNVALT